MKQERVKNLLFLFFQAVFIITVFICALNIAKSRPTNETFVNKYASSDVVYVDGTSAHFDSKNFGTVNRGDVATVHIRLPDEPLRDQPTLCFYIYHSVTEIWCGDTLLDAYGADIDARGDLVGNKRFIVPLPEEAMGGEVTIILRATEDKAFNQIKNLKLYSARDAYQYYIDADPISFAVSIPLFFLGCVALMAMLFTGHYNSEWRKGVYIALFAVLISAWMMGSKGLPAMFGLAGYGTSIMEFIAVFTVATPILLYAYESEKKGVFRTVLLSAALANIAFFALATILNFANVLHYSATLLL
ncbi:MAG: hypothetical protein PHC80_09235, partial [Eubacteriales bacterium]|nr:hypothetical protein [Eubacteriales bacterium]